MSFVRGAEAAEFRQRNIFPLPDVDLDGGGPGGFDWGSLANQGIKTLNELAGCVNSDFQTRKKPTRVQRRVLSHIAESYKEAYSHVNPKGMVGSLSSLCSSSKTYTLVDVMWSPMSRRISPGPR